MINTRDKKEHSFCDEHIFHVLPFSSMSVSLYMDFLNSSGLEVCGIVNKVCELATKDYFSYQSIYNYFGELINHLGGMGAQRL